MSGFTGGAGNDSYTGDETGEVISGNDGNDQLFGADGTDTIDGGSGDDVIGDGTIYYNWAPFAPSYIPDSFHDVLNGGSGDDFIAAGVGDALDGGPGVDTFRLDLSALNAPEVVNLSTFASTGALTLGGGATVEHMERGTIVFGSGDDTITLGSSQLTVNGGGGADHITGGGLADNIYGGDGSDSLKGGGGADVLVDSTPAMLSSGEFVIAPDTSTDSLVGGDGDDELCGGSGDTLDGGDGSDFVWLISRFSGSIKVNLSASMNGGTLVVGDATLTSIERGVLQLIGGGDDTVNAGAWSSAVLFMFSGNDKATGGAGADLLSGGGGDDVLDGGGGDDQLLAGGVQSSSDPEGNDKFNGGAGDDTADYIQLQAPFTGVTVSLAIKGPQDTGPAGVDTLVSIENLRGTNVGDHLTGDSGANKLDGYEGDDVLVGGNGADQLIGGNGSDSLSGGKGADQLIGGWFADSLSGGPGSDSFVFQSIADSLAIQRDTITDLSAGDVINLSAIDGDGNAANGHTPFAVSNHVVDGVADAVLTWDKASGYTHLDLYVNGDLTVDGSILIAGKHLDATIIV